MSKHETFTKFLRENALQLSVQGIGLVVVLANIYLSLKLAPVASDIRSLNQRVSAIEVRNTNADPLIPRFIVAEERTAQMSKDLEEIKESMLRLENKLDRLVDKR